ncbi:LpqB family beta-propeller domain-containing protein [Pseudactinotalea sp. HY158]|uniref:LpqB family beta-propeller domain-containing protein n=1 Tax=Pseudactinotalea sp. HY158 TaxID=2654547 RepID=UPI00129CCD91|nr:LpqB family beta-propeller domain-containing protein [Pseudactinotalea sp. HY158]QGH68855.1 hypothetical protein GCE65_04590 [Pseudactinotalea sp. HY158]
MTTRRPGPRALAAVLIGACALALSSCVGLPTSGPVHAGVDSAVEPDAIVFLAADPRPGDDPEQIVRGFLDANPAGVADRFETAQKYLTEAARSTWRPGGGVTIYSGTTPPSVHEVEPGHVAVELTVAAYVDETGVYTEEAPGAEKTIEFSLARVGDEWRISGLDDGVIMSAVNFGSQYRQVPLYFLSPDLRFFVPDTRWFPQGNAATSAVQALLRGPVGWLAPGVITAFPSGTRAEPVTITEGVAEVGLSQEVLAAAGPDRQILLAQLQQTLTRLPQVRRVHATAGQVDLEEGVTPINPTLDPAVGVNPIGISDGTLATVAGGEVSPLPDSVPLAAGRYGALAVPYGDGPVVGLVGGDTLATLPTAETESRTLLEAPGPLVAPSYDRFGLVWTGAQENEGRLLTADPVTGEQTEVAAPALTGRHLRALRVSRDGARLAVITEADGDVAVLVGAIVRDEQGTALDLGGAQRVGQALTDATALVWIDEQELGVLGIANNSPQTVHVVPIGGPTAALPSVPDVVSIAAGRGEHELWLGTANGDLYARSGNGWRKVGEDLTLTDPTLPG